MPPCAIPTLRNVGKTTTFEIERAIPRAKEMLRRPSAPASADREGGRVVSAQPTERVHWVWKAAGIALIVAAWEFGSWIGRLILGAIA